MRGAQEGLEKTSVFELLVTEKPATLRGVWLSDKRNSELRKTAFFDLPRDTSPIL